MKAASPALHLPLLASGGAGLIEQALWARQLGPLASSAAGGAALVAALFMARLGVACGVDLLVGVGAWVLAARFRTSGTTPSPNISFFKYISLNRDLSF